MQQLIEELLGNHISHNKMGRPKTAMDNVRYSEQHYPIMYDKPSECIIVVSQVQGSNQNTGVTDVEVFTPMFTHILKNII